MIQNRAMWALFFFFFSFSFFPYRANREPLSHGVIALQIVQFWRKRSTFSAHLQMNIFMIYIQYSTMDCCLATVT